MNAGIYKILINREYKTDELIDGKNVSMRIILEMNGGPKSKKNTGKV